jgi:hypothetical protein
MFLRLRRNVGEGGGVGQDVRAGGDLLPGAEVLGPLA